MIHWGPIVALILVCVAAAALVPLLVRLRRPGAYAGAARRVLGGALVLLGAGGLLAGQIAASGRPDEDAASMQVPVIAEPAPEGGEAARYLVRFLTLDLALPDRPRLVERASFTVDAPGEARDLARSIDGITPAECRVSISPRPGNSHLSLDLNVSAEGGSYGMGTSFLAGTSKTLVVNRPAGRGSRAGAAFPSAVFPPAMATRTVVLVDPQPARIALAPFQEAMSGAEGARIRAEGRLHGPARIEGLVRSSDGGFPRIAGTIGLFAAACILVGGTGAVLVGRRTGAWLGPYLLLAPLLLVAADRIAFVRHRDALTSDRPEVRASAMLGLRESPFFGESGAAIVEDVARNGGPEDREIARIVLDVSLPEGGGLERKNLSAADVWRARMSHPMPEERP